MVGAAGWLYAVTADGRPELLALLMCASIAVFGVCNVALASSVHYWWLYFRKRLGRK